MIYGVIMSDGYGDIRGFNVSSRNKYVVDALGRLFYNHSVLAIINMEDSYLSHSGLWHMEKGDLIDQIYLSEFNFDEDKEWKLYKGEMKEFIKKHVIK